MISYCLHSNRGIERGRSEVKTIHGTNVKRRGIRFKRSLLYELKETIRESVFSNGSKWSEFVGERWENGNGAEFEDLS